MKFYESQQDYKTYFKGIKIITHHFQPTTNYHAGRYCNGIAIIVMNINQIEDVIGLGNFNFYYKD